MIAGAPPRTRPSGAPAAPSPWPPFGVHTSPNFAKQSNNRPTNSLMKLTQQQLENHLWGAANILRGKTAGQDYKNYILSLMFYKRLCDQWENEANEAIAELERQQGHESFTEKQKAVFRARGEHLATSPKEATGATSWPHPSIWARSSPRPCAR